MKHVLFLKHPTSGNHQFMGTDKIDDIQWLSFRQQIRTESITRADPSCTGG